MTVGTEVEPLLKTAMEQIRSNKPVKIADLLSTLVEAERPAFPARVALPVQITPKQKAALDRLPDLFGKVVPMERRLLEAPEVDGLLDERDVLNEIKKMVEDRISDGIRLTVLNHHDVEVEETVPEDERAQLWRDKDGHYIPTQTTQVKGSSAHEQAFSVEPRSGSTTIDLKKLLAQVANPDAETEFSHADFLAMTTQTRVFDEAKAMLVLRKKPELLTVLRAAATKGAPSVAVQPRKAKA